VIVLDEEDRAFLEAEEEARLEEKIKGGKKEEV